MSLTIASDRLPEAWVVAPVGELDYSESGEFRAHIDRILRAMPAAVVVDLSGVEYLDSSGLGLLLSLSREYGDAGGRLVLVTNETVDGVLGITRLAPIFTIEDDVDAALEHIRHATAPGAGAVE